MQINIDVICKQLFTRTVYKIIYVIGTIVSNQESPCSEPSRTELLLGVMYTM